MFLTKLLIYPMTLLTITYGSASIPSEIYSQPIKNQVMCSIIETTLIEQEKEDINKKEEKYNEPTVAEPVIKEEQTTVPEIIIEEESEVEIKEENSEVETEEEKTSALGSLFAEFDTTKNNIEKETSREPITENQTEITTEATTQKQENSTKNESDNNKDSDLYHPFKVTNYSAETFNKVCEGTYLEGFGPYLVNLEKEYGVNGMFCLGVARAESGMGSSSIAKNKNNYFGIMGSNGAVSYSSGEECIMSFGRLMNKSIYKGKTIEQIGPIYCESSRWPKFVRECMAYNFNKI